MKLAQIMNQPVLSIEPDVTLSDAIRVMEESGRGFLPVVQDGSVVGVVTGRDIVTKGIGHGMNPDESRVVNVMTAPARTVSCDLEAEDAAILMRLHRIRRLVAIGQKGEPVGVIALADLAGSMANEELSETLHLFAVPAGTYEIHSKQIPGLYTG
ncbi:MAG: hypothetical protein BGO01_16180 [Armatimonadetes bacterium 55-13]|nr:CBS domain-containing protein [Armatimonadota bacterium]OJU65397.1 MAG: hypothetical protein BGO01_16180 [Armatimonadetes bacterium 55-13]